MRLLACVVVLILPAVPALAQRPWERAANFEQALARVIDDALPRTDQDWALTWDGFGLKGDRDVFWHLFTPEAAREDAAASLHRRSGWLSSDGGSANVALCGDAETIQTLAVTVSDIWTGRGDLVAELDRRGVVARAVEPQHPLFPQFRPNDDGRIDEGRDPGARARPVRREWRIEAAGRLPATLTSDKGCTPPGTRHATMCRTRWILSFVQTPGDDRPDRPDRPDRRFDACQSRDRYI